MSLPGHKPKYSKALWVKEQPQPRPRRQIRRRSKAMVDRMVEYNRLKAEFLAKHPDCAIYGALKWATTIHHPFGRILTKKGDLLLETRWFIPVSLEAHTKIESNKSTYRQMTWKNPVTGVLVPMVAPLGQFNKWQP